MGEIAYQRAAPFYFRRGGVIGLTRRHNNTGRSSNPDGQWVGLPYHLIRSAAWRSLNGRSVKVFLELHLGFHGNNNGDLSLGLDKAAKKLGISKSTAMRALDELEDRGFIVKTNPGAWIKGQAATYRLTTQRTKTAPRTDDWKQWKPPELAQKKRKSWGYKKRALLAIESVTKNISRFPNET